jgi:glycosyltransferase involved in cell wall biosynthesis
MKKINDELTIVIPAKNEERTIPFLLINLASQDYKEIFNTKIYIADAGSTDRTKAKIRKYKKLLGLDISIIQGGLPSVGRNNGAKKAKSKYVLFLDADVEIKDKTLIRRALDKIKSENKVLVTSFVNCSMGNILDHLMYTMSNLVQVLSCYISPFATGMFMLFDREGFNNHGRFNEDALFAEDYLLSRKVDTLKFGIVAGTVRTSNRRFKKMSRISMLCKFAGAALHYKSAAYFLKDHNYWK